MGSVNKAIILGRLGRDPEIRTLSSGDRVANLRVATSETWRDKQSGARKEKTEWHAVTVLNDNLVKVVEQYLRKGANVYLEGKIQTRKWTDQQGVEKYSTEIVVGRFDGCITLIDKAERSDADDFRGQGHGGFSGGADDSEIPF